MTDRTDVEGHSLAQFATGDGPLSPTVVACPECDRVFEGHLNDAKRSRYEHVRETHYADVLGWAKRLKEYDSDG